MSKSKKIKEEKTLPDSSITKKKISTTTSYLPVYAWYIDNTIYYYSEKLMLDILSNSIRVLL